MHVSNSRATSSHWYCPSRPVVYPFLRLNLRGEQNSGKSDPMATKEGRQFKLPLEDAGRQLSSILDTTKIQNNSLAKTTGDLMPKSDDHKRYKKFADIWPVLNEEMKTDPVVNKLKLEEIRNNNLDIQARCRLSSNALKNFQVLSSRTDAKERAESGKRNGTITLHADAGHFLTDDGSRLRHVEFPVSPGGIQEKHQPELITSHRHGEINKEPGQQFVTHIKAGKNLETTDQKTLSREDRLVHVKARENDDADFKSSGGDNYKENHLKIMNDIKTENCNPRENTSLSVPLIPYQYSYSAPELRQTGNKGDMVMSFNSDEKHGNQFEDKNGKQTVENKHMEEQQNQINRPNNTQATTEHGNSEDDVNKVKDKTGINTQEYVIQVDDGNTGVSEVVGVPSTYILARKADFSPYYMGHSEKSSMAIPPVPRNSRTTSLQNGMDDATMPEIELVKNANVWASHGEVGTSSDLTRNVYVVPSEMFEGWPESSENGGHCYFDVRTGKMMDSGFSFEKLPLDTKKKDSKVGSKHKKSKSNNTGFKLYSKQSTGKKVHNAKSISVDFGQKEDDIEKVQYFFNENRGPTNKMRSHSVDSEYVNTLDMMNLTDIGTLSLDVNEKAPQTRESNVKRQNVHMTSFPKIKGIQNSNIILVTNPSAVMKPDTNQPEIKQPITEKLWFEPPRENILAYQENADLVEQQSQRQMEAECQRIPQMTGLQGDQLVMVPQGNTAAIASSKEFPLTYKYVHLVRPSSTTSSQSSVHLPGTGVCKGTSGSTMATTTLPKITPCSTPLPPGLAPQRSHSSASMYGAYPPKELSNTIDFIHIPRRINPLHPHPPRIRINTSWETVDPHWENEKRRMLMQQREHTRYHSAWSKAFYGAPAEKEAYRRHFRETLKQQMLDKDVLKKTQMAEKVKESERALDYDKQCRLNDAKEYFRKHHFLMQYRDSNKFQMENTWAKTRFNKTVEDRIDRERLRYNPINWSCTLK